MSRKNRETYLQEADAIVAKLEGRVWYKTLPGRFLIYSERDGLIARRVHSSELVEVLHSQVPAGQLVLRHRKRKNDTPES